VGIEEVFPRDYILSCTEESLTQSQARFAGPSATARVESGVDSAGRVAPGFEDLKKSGKAKSVGVSLNNHDPDPLWS